MQFIHVPYKGGGPALTEVLGGQVQALFSIALAAMPQVKAGRVRALAITSASVRALAPDLPTVAESGFPGFEVIGWFGWVAPAKTPAEIVTRLQSRNRAHTASCPTCRSACSHSAPIRSATALQEFAAFIKSEHDKWARVIRQANIRAE